MWVGSMKKLTHKDGMTWNQEEVGKVVVGLFHESVYWDWYFI